MADPIRDSVVVRVSGAETWRFLDRCARDNIVLTDVRAEDDFTLTARLPLAALNSAAEIARRSGCELTALSVRGAARLGEKLRRSRSALVGLAAAFAALLVSSLFVWDVRVAENDSDVPDAVIVRVLDSQGVGVGSFWPAFRGERIRTKALLELPELCFLAVNVRGSTAWVEARAIGTKPEIYDPSVPADIIARRPGVVESVTALSGAARTARGDAVKAGDLLIEGTEVNPRARGEVTAFTWHELTARAPLSYARPKPEGRKKHYLSLILGSNRYYFFTDSGILPTGCVKMTRAYTPGLRDLLSLPVRLVVETVQPCRTEWIDAERESVYDSLTSALEKTLEQRLGQDAQVLDRHWSVSEEGEWMTLTLRASCLEPIGAETTK